MNRALGHLLSLVLLLLTASALHAADKKPDVMRGANESLVPMRDGVKLATNVFLPKGDGPWPVILTRTPYSKDGTFGMLWSRYVGANYAFVIQDCRGRFRSEGDYRPFEDDLNDGFDTVNWIAAQPWCNGKVGMSGASAMGITSLLGAIAQPAALQAAYVVVAPESMWNEASWINGVFKEADVTGWMHSQGADDQVEARKLTLLDTADERARDILHNRHKIRIPIYHVGGWYDIFAVGTQGNFSFLHNHGAEGARGRQKLLMGPFGHGNLAGDLKYKDGLGLLGALKDELPWFDYHLKGIQNEMASEPAVKYYQMAAALKNAFSDKNGWRTADNWPPKSRPTRYYVASSGGLSTVAPTSAPSSTSYMHDPKNPVPTVGGANLTLPLGPKDQREINGRDDYLRFQSEPLDADLTIAGPVNVDLHASTDAPDTDFVLKLVDVYPDGYEALVLDAPIRTMYREGREPGQIKRMQPGKPARMNVLLGSTALVFEKGHRVALHIASSNYPRFEVNPNTGDLPGQVKSEPHPARNTIHHDAEHPTALILPVVE
jgi:predicted acyl esterase